MQASESLDALELPPLDLRSKLRFGPGMILMMIGIGTSHVVTAPVADGQFDFQLIHELSTAMLSYPLDVIKCQQVSQKGIANHDRYQKSAAGPGEGVWGSG